MDKEKESYYFPILNKSIFRYGLLLTIFFCPLLGEVGYISPWGKDSTLLPKTSKIPALPKRNLTLWEKAAEKIILFHQNVLSPVDGPRSHFRPTSSRYMLLSIKRHGMLRGFLMGCDRLLRENKEEWVYRKTFINGKWYKWDPTYGKQKIRKRCKPDSVSHLTKVSDNHSSRDFVAKILMRS